MSVDVVGGLGVAVAVGSESCCVVVAAAEFEAGWETVAVESGQSAELVQNVVLVVLDIGKGTNMPGELDGALGVPRVELELVVGVLVPEGDGLGLLPIFCAGGVPLKP